MKDKHDKDMGSMQHVDAKILKSKDDLIYTSSYNYTEEARIAIRTLSIHQKKGCTLLNLVKLLNGRDLVMLSTEQTSDEDVDNLRHLDDSEIERLLKDLIKREYIIEKDEYDPPKKTFIKYVYVSKNAIEEFEETGIQIILETYKDCSEKKRVLQKIESKESNKQKFQYFSQNFEDEQIILEEFKIIEDKDINEYGSLSKLEFQTLLDDLKEVRKEIYLNSNMRFNISSDEIVSDDALKEICRILPTTQRELLSCRYVDVKSLVLFEAFEPILNAISNFLRSETTIQRINFIRDLLGQNSQSTNLSEENSNSYSQENKQYRSNVDYRDKKESQNYYSQQPISNNTEFTTITLKIPEKITKRSISKTDFSSNLDSCTKKILPNSQMKLSDLVPSATTEYLNSFTKLTKNS